MGRNRSTSEPGEARTAQSGPTAEDTSTAEGKPLDTGGASQDTQGANSGGESSKFDPLTQPLDPEYRAELQARADALKLTERAWVNESLRLHDLYKRAVWHHTKARTLIDGLEAIVAVGEVPLPPS